MWFFSDSRASRNSSRQPHLPADLMPWWLRPPCRPQRVSDQCLDPWSSGRWRTRHCRRPVQTDAATLWTSWHCWIIMLFGPYTDSIFPSEMEYEWTSSVIGSDYESQRQSEPEISKPKETIHIELSSAESMNSYIRHETSQIKGSNCNQDRGGAQTSGQCKTLHPVFPIGVG